MGQYIRKDALYNRAKEEGYASRAAYKLIELNKNYRILKPGFKVLDLGCWPGGWLKIASEAVGPAGLVIGVDLQAVEETFPQNVKVITADVREKETLNTALALASSRFDLILSDMSPKLSGIPEADRAQAVALAELAIFVASQALVPQGQIVIKVFKSPDTDAFVKSNRPLFNKLLRVELDSTRKTSNEFYLIGQGFKGTA